MSETEPSSSQAVDLELWRPFLGRLLYGALLLFIASQFMVLVRFIAAYRLQSRISWAPVFETTVTVLILLVLTRKCFGLRFEPTFGIAVVLAMAFSVASPFLRWPHPLYRYAVLVDSETSDGGAVYYRDSAAARKAAKLSFLYSPRIGLFWGEGLGRSRGAPALPSQQEGVRAWLFGPRLTSELFVLLLINFYPFVVFYGIYCHWRRRPASKSAALVPLRSAWLVGPVLLGLVPLIGQ